LPFTQIASALRCPHCGAQYPVVEGIPVLLDPNRVSATHLSAEQRQWDAQAETYEAGRLEDPIYMAGVRSAVARLKVRAGDRVLDAACGTGLTVRRYQRPGVRTVALDLSLQSLRYLRRQLPAVDLVCGDLTSLPFAEGAFDKVLCANALQHLPDADHRSRTVAELARVARPGGRVVVTAHNYSAIKQRQGWTKAGAARGSSGPVQWIYRFDTAEFEALLAQVLEVHKVTGAGLPLLYRYKLSPLMRLVERLAGNFRLSTRWSNMLLGIASRR
jgi:ubiquinone/menaquinone biosynthesis C-methylase UbiE